MEATVGEAAPGRDGSGQELQHCEMDSTLEAEAEAL